MRRIEENACLSRLRRRTVETCVLCAGLASCSLAIPSPLAGASVLVACLVVAGCAGISLRDYLRILVAASGFAAFSLLPFSVAVRTAPPSLEWDPQGLRTGLLAATRAVGTLSATLLLAFTTPFPRLLSLLRLLRCPALATDLLALVHREIFLLDEVSSRLRAGLASRAGWNGTASGLRSLSLGTAALLVQALEHSRRLEAGLASRGAVDGTTLFQGEDLSVRPLPLFGALVVPAALAAGILWGRSRLGL